MKIFRDPVHDIIRFDKEKDKLILDLIDTKEMQRLRRIKQLGFGSFTYPGADHSRFSHSLGTAYLMKRVIEHLTNKRGKQEKRWLEEITSNYCLLLCSALLHDIGHGPFSHAFEGFTGIKHEQWTMQIVKNPITEVNQVLESFKRGFAQQVVEVIARIYPCETVVKLLSSQLDVDRIDYLLRDSLLTGAGYGRFDLEWLLHTITIGAVDEIPEVGIDYDKGVSIAEDFVMARYYMYKHVYFHKATRSAEIIAKKVFDRVKCLIQSNDIDYPEQLDVFSSNSIDEPGLTAYLELDDSIFWYWFREWEGNRDACLKDLCGRILNRKLFKSIDVSNLGINELMEIIRSIKEEAALIGEHFANYIEVDTPSTSSYSDPYLSKRFRTNRGNQIKYGEYNYTDGNGDEQMEASEQIFLFDKQKKSYDLARVSPIINAIREQKLEHQRLYYPEKLHETVGKLLGGR